MGFQIQPPGLANPFELAIGEVLFLVGANGTGKSALLANLKSEFPKAVWLPAHRQTWLNTDSANMTGTEFERFQSNFSNADLQNNARVRYEWPEKRQAGVLFEFANRENERNRRIAEAVDKPGPVAPAPIEDARDRYKSPLVELNGLLGAASLPQVQLDKHRFVSLGDKPYGIDWLSDGERSALLISMAVLAAEPKSLLLLDEPEIHLHGSILTELVRGIVDARPDCAFVIATHALELPVVLRPSRTLVLRGCSFQSGKPDRWDCDLLSDASDLPDDLRATILGPRRLLLFVEGQSSSLDVPLYQRLFPMTTVLSKGSCRDVEKAVKGIRATTDAGWVRAFGIIDNDGRAPQELTSIRADGLYALGVFAVESIYYDTEVQRRVAVAVAGVDGSEIEARLAKARVDALEAIKTSSRHLAARLAAARIHALAIAGLPEHKEVEEGIPLQKIELDPNAIAREEQQRLDGLVADGKLDEIVRSYPVRESAALERIAVALGLQNRKQYEASVVNLPGQDDQLLAHVNGAFSDLIDDISGSIAASPAIGSAGAGAH